MRFILPLALIATTTAQADVTVSFRDGAPKDRFSITNTGTCAVPPVSVLIDLSTAPAGLIFDITAAGDGVEVFQPFEVVEGAELIVVASDVADGDQKLQLDLSGLPVDATVGFTIDLDDTGGGREITVSGSEIAGTRIVVATDDDLVEATFNDQGQATAAAVACVS